jgi:hypothetical protein
VYFRVIDDPTVVRAGAESHSFRGVPVADGVEIVVTAVFDSDDNVSAQPAVLAGKLQAAAALGNLVGAVVITQDSENVKPELLPCVLGVRKGGLEAALLVTREGVDVVLEGRVELYHYVNVAIGVDIGAVPVGALKVDIVALATVVNRGVRRVESITDR